MICAEARELLESYAKGATDAAAREALEAHFATCEGCRLEAELARSINTEGDEAEAPLTLESLATSSVPEESGAPARAEEDAAAPASAPPPPAPALEAGGGEEISFSDLVLEAPEASSTASPVVAPPVSSPAGGARLGASGVPAGVANSTGPRSSAPAWDFEPVDPPRDAGPPAESINLAEQAFSRKAQAKAKGKVAALRVVLWAAGGLSGIALLGVSIWIALAFNQPIPGESGPGMIGAGETPAGAGVDSGAGGALSADGSADSASSGPGAEGVPVDGSAEPPPTTPDGSVENPGGGGETTSPDGRLLRAGALPLAGAGPSGAPVATPRKTVKPAPAASASRPPSTASKSTASTTTQPRTTATTPSGGTSSGASRKALGPKAPVDDLEPVTDESEIPFTTAPKREAPPTSSSAGSTPAGGTVKPAPGGSSATTAPTAGPEVAAPAAPSPAPVAPSKPIDRLHEATVQATVAEDLEALRKHKVSWKAMIRTATAAERARAKREYADCLWAIQELSGRTQDRREALAAYRDYVLYAPAGANDARTVGRMRFLEDVLAESE